MILTEKLKLSNRLSIYRFNLLIILTFKKFKIIIYFILFSYLINSLINYLIFSNLNIFPIFLIWIYWRDRWFHVFISFIYKLRGIHTQYMIYNIYIL